MVFIPARLSMLGAAIFLVSCGESAEERSSETLPQSQTSQLTTDEESHEQEVEAKEPNEFDLIESRLREQIFAAGSPQVERAKDNVDRIGADGRWEDIPLQPLASGAPMSKFKPRFHAVRVAEMARAWADPVSSLYGDEKLLNTTISALDALVDSGLLLQEKFDPNQWFAFEIGVPLQLTETLLLLGDRLPEESRKAALEMLKKREGMNRSISSHDGQNRVWRAIVRLRIGVMNHDEREVKISLKYIAENFKITGGQGLRADYSYLFHGPLLYSWGYGYASAQHGAAMACAMRETSFTFPPQELANLSAFVLDHMQWLVWRGSVDHSAVGRSIVRRDRSLGKFELALEQLAAADATRTDEYVGALDRIRNEAKSSQLIGNRNFWEADFMVHRRPEFYTSVRMLSNRTVNTDHWHHGEGLRSHHLGEGTTWIMQSGQEYAGDTLPTWNWQRIPGTTVVQDGNFKKRPKHGAEGSFVGGVSDDELGIAVMDFQVDDVAAKKAWFFFDEGFVALGAGITSNADDKTITTVNQCQAESEVLYSAEEGIIEITSMVEQGVTVKTPGFVWQNRILYVLPIAENARVSVGQRSGNWSKINRQRTGTVTATIFSLWIDHGIGPSDEKYAYYVLPDVARNEAEAKALEPPFKIIRNDPQVQAVRHLNKEIMGVVFYEAGELESLEGFSLKTDNPCILLLDLRSKDTAILSVADPTQKLSDLTVGLSRKSDVWHQQISVDLPTGPHAGKSTKVYLKLSQNLSTLNP